jgi:hypothetical protein
LNPAQTKLIPWVRQRLRGDLDRAFAVLGEPVEVREVALARLEQTGGKTVGKRIVRRIPTARTTAHPGAHRTVPEVKADEYTKPRTDPFMIDMSVGLHRVLHRLINALVKDNKVLAEFGLTALGGPTGSGSAWEKALTDNPAAQEAMEAVLKRAADVIDKECGNVKLFCFRRKRRFED